MEKKKLHTRYGSVCVTFGNCVCEEMGLEKKEREIDNHNNNIVSIHDLCAVCEYK